MQILESVVNDRKPKMLTGFSCSGYGGSPLFRHGRTALPAYREHLLYRVTSLEQGKPVSLPARGRSTVRWIDGGAGIGIARKRMLPCNRADRLRPVKLVIVIVPRKKFSSVRTASPMASTLGVIAGRERPVM